MRIAVIAADGRSGRVFVEAALAAGHQVRAGVRSEDPFGGERANLSVVQCDATNLQQVEELLRSTDGVVSLLGHVRGSTADVQTTATRMVIEVMNRRGLKRIVSLTGTGVRIDGDKPNLIDKLANEFIVRVDPNRVHDGIAHVEVLKKSDADFTVVRVLKLSNSTGASQFSLTKHGPAKMFTSRQEVAVAILDCLEDNRFIRQYPVISRQ
ncbi:MAG: NAD(P)H-binding protein [Patescibacteria group bacterium]